MISTKKIVGERVKKYLSSKFERIEDGAKYLGTTGNSLKNSILNGKSYPGAKIIYGLMKLGCDIGWLFNPDNDLIELPERVDYSNSQKDMVIKELEAAQYQLKEENIKLRQTVKEFKQFGLKITEYAIENESKVEKGNAKSTTE